MAICGNSSLGSDAEVLVAEFSNVAAAAYAIVQRCPICHRWADGPAASSPGGSLCTRWRDCIGAVGIHVGPDVPRQLAAVIRGDPGASAWIVNSQPIIYFRAGIDAPIRFPFPSQLVGDQSAMTGTDPVAEVERIPAGRRRFPVVDKARWGNLAPNVDVFRLSPSASPPGAWFVGTQAPASYPLNIETVANVKTEPSILFGSISAAWVISNCTAS